MNHENYLHVSQYFIKQSTVCSVTGVETAQYVPAFPKGKTYNIGRNAFKRMCKRNGLRRVQIERRAEAV